MYMIRNWVTTFILSFLSATALAVPASLSIPQGAIWNLRERGQTADANRLEEHLRQVLMTEDIKQVAEIIEGKGISTSYFVKFQNNIVAVMKEDDDGKVKNAYRFEVANFILDRLLGLNMVPVTVHRQIEGINYSLQLFYNPTDLYAPGAENTDYAKRYSDLILFDSLNINVDRPEDKNIVRGEDGRLVAIDHTRTFMHSIDKIYFSPAIASKVSPELHRAVLELRPERVQEALAPYLNEQEISDLLMRIKEMKKILTQNQPEGPTRISRDRSKEPLPRAWDFKLSTKLEKMKFFDLIAIRSGLRPKATDAAKALRAFENAAESKTARSFIYQMVSKNYSSYSKEVRGIVAQHLASGQFDNYLIGGYELPEKIAKDFTDVGLQLLQNERLRVSLIYPIMAGIHSHHDLHPNEELRKLVMHHYVQHDVSSIVSMDIEVLIGEEFNDGKKAFLAEFYRTLKQAGKEKDLFSILRLRQPSKAYLAEELLKSVDGAHTDEVRALMNQGYEQLIAKNDANAKHAEKMLATLKTVTIPSHALITLPDTNTLSKQPTGKAMCSKVLLN